MGSESDASPSAYGSLAPETRRVYASAWDQFRRWALLRGAEPLPAASLTLSNYLSEHGLRYSESALRRVIDAVALWHHEHGHPSPADQSVDRVWQQVRRLRQEREADLLSGALPEELVLPEAFLSCRLRKMLDALPGDLRGCRDRLLLLAGAAGRLTKTELVRLEVHDVEDVSGDVQDVGCGALLRIFPSKAEQRADPHWVVRSVRVAAARGPDYDVGCAYESWVRESGIAEGPVLRSVDRSGRVSESGLSIQGVNLAVRRAAERANLKSRGYMDEVRRAIT